MAANADTAAQQPTAADEVEQVKSAPVSSAAPAGGSGQNPLTRKINKILETRLDNDPEMLEALTVLSKFFNENTLRSRRNLRSDIERRSLSVNVDFCDAFRGVKEQLDDMCYDVKTMNDCVQDMKMRLQKTKEQTSDLIRQTTQLQCESKRIQMKQQVVNAFLAKYTLQPEEVKELRGMKDGHISSNFFLALERVKQIHSDCKVLLRTKEQTAGIQIMEAMTMHQEAAFEKLFRWAQAECRLLNIESPDIPPLLCQAVEALQDRPVLFKYSIDEFATARRMAVVRSFIDALTRGGPYGTPRPMELHAHDPLRYVGDMLAWIHQATASECEQLHSLLRLVKVEPDSETDIQVKLAMTHIMEGVCRPLKVRVEQVVVSEPGPVILYKLANLIQFYFDTLSPSLEKSASLLSTVAEMHELASKMFFNSLNSHTSKLMEKIELPPSDLGPSALLTQTLSLLQEVLACHDSSVVTLDAKQSDFSKILSSVIDPLLQMCSVSASRLSTVDMAVYMVNCIYTIHSTLALYEFTDTRLEMLQAQIEAHLDAVVSEQASYILSKTGLSNLYGVIQQGQEQKPLSAVNDLDALTMKSAMGRFDAYLANPDSLILGQCALLMSATIRETIRKRAVDLICHAYKQMYSTIREPANNYPEPNSLVPRNPEQVEKLLV